ncbi:transaldolase family protein [Streptomyces mirabilis]|uniref:transaldolase family protein n=1 Tax=Streptomyces mirabilis TaxID=68239 RepID=UPI0033DEDE0F
MYVSELVVPGTVNTMPASTLDAFADHGHVPAAAPVADTYTSAAAHFEELGRTGIDFMDVTDTLEREGLAKFEDSWAELGATVDREMRADADASEDGTGPSGESSNAPALLAIYLNDHLAGATGGLELCRRAAQGQRDEERATAFSTLAKQVEEDHDSLVQIMFDLGVSTDHPKVALGRLTEKAGRLKPNGRLFSRSPLSDVLELESMLLGVQGKASCWRTLRVLAEDDDRLYAEHLDALLERAEHQTATLEELLLAAAAHTLGHAAVCAPGSSLTQLTGPPNSPSSPASSGSAAEVAHEQAAPRALPGRPPSQQDLRAAGER